MPIQFNQKRKSMLAKHLKSLKILCDSKGEVQVKIPLFNNNVQNLEYGISSKVQYANTARALKRKPCYKFDLDCRMIKKYASVNEAAEDINCSIYSVRDACSNKAKLKGCYWAYSPIILKMPDSE